MKKIRDFKCIECGYEIIDIFVYDDDTPVCPECKGTMKYMFSAVPAIWNCSTDTVSKGKMTK